MTEKQYDEINAPMLADVARRCSELGMSIVARVEYEKDSAGITHQGVTAESGVAQQMALYACLSRGNLDGMLISMRRAGVDMSQTIVGSIFGVKP